MNEVGINYHKALGENVHNTWNIQHTFISESFTNTVKLPRAVWQCAGSKVLDCISEQTLLTIDTVYKVVRNEAQLCKNYKKISRSNIKAGALYLGTIGAAAATHYCILEPLLPQTNLLISWVALSYLGSKTFACFSRQII